jgi:hypothetical protein
MDRSDFSAGHTSLPPVRGCARGWAMAPTGGDLILYTLNRPTHSVPADPAVVIAAVLVISGLSRSHGVCRPAALTAFAMPKLARLHGRKT